MNYLKISLSIFVLLVTKLVLSQCEKEISTNPNDPINEEFLNLMNNWFPFPDETNQVPYNVNSFLNTNFNWYENNSIVIDLSDGWSNPVFPSSGTYSMENPYSSSHPANHLNTAPYVSSPGVQDYLWEDGWELLWMNLGMYPNGDRLDAPSQGSYYYTSEGNGQIDVYNPDPNQVPFFAIYNRYRGVVRLFANVWQDQLNLNFQNVVISMEFVGYNNPPNNVSGIFRHASQLDKALDQITTSLRITSPRKQPAVNSDNWLVSEFQIAFDPCICMKEYITSDPSDPGRIRFVFTTYDATSIDLLSRGIETQQEIDDSNLNDDFMNLSDYNTGNYEPGTVMYKQMEDMFSSYKDDLEKYNQEMEDYNEAENDAKKQLLDIGTDLVTGALNYAIPGGNILSGLVSDNDIYDDGSDDPTKLINGTMKGLIGLGADYANYEIFGPQDETEPKKPTQPVANFTETYYRGTLTNVDPIPGPDLFVPGGFDEYVSNSGNNVGYGETEPSPKNFPAYNKVLGQATLLRTPSLILNKDFNSEWDWEFPENDDFCAERIVGSWDLNLDLKIDEPLEVALNRAIDFDYDKTSTFVNLELVLEIIDSDEGVDDPVAVEPGSNMIINHQTINEGVKTIQYNSKWIPLDIANQYVFSLEHKNDNFIRTLCTGPPSGSAPCCGNDWTLGDAEELLRPKVIIKSIKVKMLHDMFFEQIGSSGSQINNTQVHSYLVYSDEEGINLLDTDLEDWESGTPAVAQPFTPGTITLENEFINTTHWAVTEVDGDIIYIDAETVEIEGHLIAQSGYTVVIQALTKIHVAPESKISPMVHLRIKRDFFSMPMMEYVSNSEVYNFCNSSNGYQANSATRAAIDRREHSSKAEQKKRSDIENSVVIYPNPTSHLINVRSSILELSSITVMDVSGREVKETNGLRPNQLNATVQVGDLKPGIYFVKTNCSGVITTDRLVISR